MKMVSMELSEEEMKAACEPCVSTKESRPKYPWGLTVRLDTEQIKKLGLKALPGVGTVLMMQARVEVCEISQNESVDGGDRQHMALQITEMSIGAEPTQKSPAEVLYKKE